MPEVVRFANGGERVADAFVVVRAEDVDAADPATAIVPFSVWQERGRLGGSSARIWLKPDDDFRLLRDAVAGLELIALEFPKLTDGRAYSIATILRAHFGYRGELRAIGEVQIDQLHFMRGTGFDSAVLPPQFAAQWPAIRAALATFSDAYQATIDQQLPAYRRQLRPHAGRKLAS